jgi:Fe-S cluster assembly scaffold IscU
MAMLRSMMRFAPAAATMRLAVVRVPVAARAYHEDLIDHYENPRNVGRLDKKANNVGTGLVGAPACGDVMQLQIQVDDDGKITESKFKTFGCGSAIASSSLATEWLKGKTIGEAAEITNKQIATELKLPPVKLHCRCADRKPHSPSSRACRGPQAPSPSPPARSLHCPGKTRFAKNLSWQ